MDASFIPVEVVPSKTPFGLDQLRRSFKSALSATAAIAAAPAVGTADETFPNMFLTPVSTPESAESATRIDLVYMGCFGGAGGSPTLPDEKRDSGDTVQSASSIRPKSGLPLTSPLTVQYYAPTKRVTFFSFGAEGTRGHVADPTDEVRVITVTIADAAYSFSGFTGELVANFFTPLIVNTLESTEIVPGKYWQNTEQKTKTLSPWIFDFTAGNYLQMSGSGHGYFVGDTLTITDGTYTATISVGTVGSSTREIISFTTTANTFNYSSTSPFTATGGSSGSGGATFWTVDIS